MFARVAQARQRERRFTDDAAHELRTPLAAMAIHLIHLLWGFIGPQNARFTDFVPTRQRLQQYLNDRRQGKHDDPDHHNPLGGLMIIALLSSLLLTGLSGWLTTADMFWGVDRLEKLHEAFANLTMTLVVVHISVVSLFSWLGPHNLIRTLWTGYRRG